MVRIEINTGNAAFCDNDGDQTAFSFASEVSRILREEVIKDLRTKNLYDINGNKVGKIEVEYDYNNKKKLYDYFSLNEIDEINDDIIIINGKEYEYEITLSNNYTDEECCRVEINGEYYYFG